MSNIIDIDRVGMVYETGSGPVEALRDITLSVAGGEFVSLVGPSGCGKSTLLRVLAGLRPMTSGAIVVDGQRVTRPIPRRRWLSSRSACPRSTRSCSQPT